MQITKAQLLALLEMMPDPARICDTTGQTVAENRAARALGWPHPRTESDKAGANQAPRQDDAHVLQAYDLGEGFCLHVQRASLPAQNGYLADTQTLIHGLLHEIRNPLASVLTAASLLQNLPGMEEENLLLLEVMRKESLRIKRVLDEISQYVDLPVPHPALFDFAEAARDVVAELRHDGVIPPTVAVQDELPEQCLIVADEVQMRIALRSLVQNAAEAVAEHGSIRLTYREDAGDMVFCVADSGSGFTEESARRAFEPFYSTKPRSTGLGLSLAQAAVEAAQARIWIEGTAADLHRTSDAEAPSGARVYIKLPSPSTTA